MARRNIHLSHASGCMFCKDIADSPHRPTRGGAFCARSRDEARTTAGPDLCYPGSTMSLPAKKMERAGKTEKISVSLGRDELVALRRRARKLYGGNLSAVVAEGVRRIQEEEGREALVDWLGKAGEASAAERNRLRAEWQDAESAPPVKRRKIQ